MVNKKEESEIRKITTIRLSPLEKAEIAKYAKVVGLEPSGFIRMAVKEKINRLKKSK